MKTPTTAPHRLGAQVWLEPTDSPERVDHLFHMLAQSGMGWARLFLMWPWIEPSPGKWDFSLFDRAYAAAGRHGIRIKATLTANSGPWHLGTPSMLHSHTGILDEAQIPAMERYIRACVSRYAGNPAHGQWLLWNEPFGKPLRTKHALRNWQRWLEEHFKGDLGPLNQRWRTGYSTFDEIPFPEEIPHPMHRGENWNSYGPWLLDWRFRAETVISELTWIRSIVTELDPEAEIVINPNQVIANHAESATDLRAMAGLSHVLGASFHPAWHFTWALRHEFPALIAAGVHFLHHDRCRVEITEVQFGNTVNSSVRPAAVRPRELKLFLLAGLAAGAEQVIGWCLNVRSKDFEAGDWGLLDNQDQPSPRSRALRDVSENLARIESHWGSLAAAQPEAHVLVDPDSQALEWTEAGMGQTVPGREEHDAARGAGKIAALLAQLGIGTGLTAASQLPGSVPEGTLIVVSHLVAWDPPLAEKLLHLAEAGATLLIDGSSGRKSPDADLHRPWPAGFEGTGLTAADLDSNPAGFPLFDQARPAGTLLLTRFIPAPLPEPWSAFGSLRFADDASPVVLQRSLGKGRLLLFRGLLGPSLLHDPDLAPTLRNLFRVLAPPSPLPRPASPRDGVIAIPCRLGQSPATLVLVDPEVPEYDSGLPLSAPDGSFHDAWADSAIPRDRFGDLRLRPSDGIALLYQGFPA